MVLVYFQLTTDIRNSVKPVMTVYFVSLCILYSAYLMFSAISANKI